MITVINYAILILAICGGTLASFVALYRVYNAVRYRIFAFPKRGSKNNEIYALEKRPLAYFSLLLLFIAAFIMCAIVTSIFIMLFIEWAF